MNLHERTGRECLFFNAPFLSANNEMAFTIAFDKRINRCKFTNMDDQLWHLVCIHGNARSLQRNWPFFLVKWLDPYERALIPQPRWCSPLKCNERFRILQWATFERLN